MTASAGTCRVIIVLLLLVFFAFSCKDNPVKPPDAQPTNCTYAPGNRNFTWRLDTIGWMGSWRPNVWAFSDTDAYVMGYLIQKDHQLALGLHWNGSSWDKNIYGTLEEIKHMPQDVTGDDFYMVSVGYWGIDHIDYPGLAEFDNRIKKWKGYRFQTVGALQSVWTDGKGFFIAGGDNGMLYTKDGYTAPWVYSKAPTDYSINRISGISKNEIYMMAALADAGGIHSHGLRYLSGEWTRLFDTSDTTGIPIKLNNDDLAPYYLNAYRCSSSDSLKIWIIGEQCFVYESHNYSIKFKRTNLASLGLPFLSPKTAGIFIFTFTPSDQWIVGNGFNYQHWNGLNYQRIYIPGLPTQNVSICFPGRFIKSRTGSIFFPTNAIAPQIFLMAIGTPQ